MTCAESRLLIPELVSLGVDWITVTQKPDWSNTPLTAIAGSLLSLEKSLGNNLKPWSSCGYEGFHCGQVDVGTRADGCIVRLSSERARSDWSKVLEVASGCSRLDLQFTFRLPWSIRSELMKVYRQAKKYRPKTGAPAVVSLLSSTDGSCTVYLGKRSSEQMGRVYDKGVESGIPELDQTVRFECEFKKHRAKGIAFYLLQSPAREQAMVAELSGFFADRGVVSQLFRYAGQADLVKRLEYIRCIATDCEASLRWLERSVKPSVRRLLDHDRRADVLRALGLDDSTGFDVGPCKEGKSDGSL